MTTPPDPTRTFGKPDSGTGADRHDTSGELSHPRATITNNPAHRRRHHDQRTPRERSGLMSDTGVDKRPNLAHAPSRWVNWL